MDFEIRNSVLIRLRTVQTLFDGITTDRNRYLNNFRKWRECRNRTLLALQKFQEEFDTIHLYSSTGRAVGNGATILGSLATIIGFGMSFSKDLNPIGSELMKYGSTVSTIGGVTSVTASLVEKGFSAKVLNEVKAALKEDERLTKELLDWFQRTEELESNIQEVFDCSVTDMSDIFIAIGGINDIYTEGGKALTDIQHFLSSLIKGDFSLSHLSNLDSKGLEKILRNASYKVKLLLLDFCNRPAVRKAIWAVIDSFKKNPISFDLSKMCICVGRKMVEQDIALLNKIPLVGDQCLVRCAGLTVRGIFQAIIFASNLLAFLSAVKDIKSGRSKYSEMIEKTQKYLSDELVMLESYPMLRN